jgi:ribosomal protein S6
MYRVNDERDVHLYEVLCLFNPNIPEDDLKERAMYYREVLCDNGSACTIQNRGKRSLCYPIQGCVTATYVQILYLATEDLLKIFDLELKRDDTILRYIRTKLYELPPILEPLR